MKMDVYEGQSKINEIELNSIFGKKSDASLYQTVVAMLSHEREGNAFTLTKSEVSGGGKKPWRQKGLGRARAGSTRSPLWRGGGVTFGPKPRDFAKDVNKKQKIKSILTVFSRLSEMERIKIFKDFEFSTAKTKEFVKAFKDYIENKNEKIVIILFEYNKSMVLASRNLPNIKLLYSDNIDLLSLVYADRILISEKAALKLDEKFHQLYL